MLSEVCAYLRNYFVRSDRDIINGVFTIKDGCVEGLDDIIKEGQYFRIVGSIYNDGVYQSPETGLQDEEFCGAVWAMAVPPTVIALCSEIERWCHDKKEVLNSPYTSESFSGYSYSKASGSDGSKALSWQNQFASKLSRWRRIRVL